MRRSCSESSFHFFLPHVSNLRPGDPGFHDRFAFLDRTHQNKALRECVFCGEHAVPFTPEEWEAARAAYLALPTKKARIARPKDAPSTKKKRKRRTPARQEQP